MLELFEVPTPVFLEMCWTCFHMKPEKQFSALFRKRQAFKHSCDMIVCILFQTQGET